MLRVSNVAWERNGRCSANSERGESGFKDKNNTGTDLGGSLGHAPPASENLNFFDSQLARECF